MTTEMWYLIVGLWFGCGIGTVIMAVVVDDGSWSESFWTNLFAVMLALCFAPPLLVIELVEYTIKKWRQSYNKKKT